MSTLSQVGCCLPRLSLIVDLCRAAIAESGSSPVSGLCKAKYRYHFRQYLSLLFQ
ncbi:MAG: hypothetical protein ACR5LD_02320 [Symbiopectobacterium sp.]